MAARAKSCVGARGSYIGRGDGERAGRPALATVNTNPTIAGDVYHLLISTQRDVSAR